MATTSEYRSYKKLHKYVGFAVLISAFSMAAAGFYLGYFSNLDYFETFSYFFALPWFIWFFSIYITIKMKKFGLHRILSNSLVKGCIAVPLTRLLGAFL